MAKQCFAPVFEGASRCVCALKVLVYMLQLIALLILLIITLGSSAVLCMIKGVIFRMQHCREGNADPYIDLNLSSYERHVQAFRREYDKSAEWEQWMFDNRGRFEYAFNKAKSKPAVLDIAFRYDSAPIAYDPPWTNEAEHMAALEAMAEPCFAGYDFNFIFNGNTTSSYANVIAGIPTNSSHASGKNVYLYYEAIFNHEFGHIMGLPHHYDTIDQVGDGLHMPPGDTTCLMDRSQSQFCSACRTALGIPLNVDNDALISAARTVIASRYPY